MAAAHDRPHQAGVVAPIRNQIAYSLGWAWGGVGSKTQHPIFQQNTEASRLAAATTKCGLRWLSMKERPLEDRSLLGI